MAIDTLRIIEEDVHALVLSLRLIRANPSLPPQLIPTLEAGIAAAERALVQCQAIEPDSLTAT